VKIRISAPLTCLTVFALFAAYTPAQSRADRFPSVGHTIMPDVAKTQQEAAKNPDATSEADTCAFTFTSPGPNNSSMKFCVTVNGNIIDFQKPIGIEQINQGVIGEGYGICDTSTGVAYYDYSDWGISSNWSGPVTLLSSPTAVKIERTTSDGLWTLTQTIAKIAGTAPYAKVTMALKNNSGSTKLAYLIRYADSDPYNANVTGDFTENLDSTFNSAWAYISLHTTSANSPYGLMIEIIGAPNVAGSFWDGFDQNIAPGPNPCAPTANWTGTLTGVDGSILLAVGMDLGKQKTGTVNLKYDAF